VSGSLQALDLVNQTLLSRGDTVIVEQETYQGRAETGLTRLGVTASASRSTMRECGWDAGLGGSTLAELKSRRQSGRNISTPSRPLQNPTRHHHAGDAPQPIAASCRRIWRADLRGRLLCRSDLGRAIAPAPRSMP